MVFHYTNFVVETNIWWIRRIRPLIFTPVATYILWMGYRYYFFGKNAALIQNMTDEETLKEQARINSREWGYNAHYKPDLDRSMKKVLYQDPNYQFPVAWVDRYTGDERTLEQIMEDENERWTYYK